MNFETYYLISIPGFVVGIMTARFFSGRYWPSVRTRLGGAAKLLGRLFFLGYLVSHSRDSGDHADLSDPFAVCSADQDSDHPAGRFVDRSQFRPGNRQSGQPSVSKATVLHWLSAPVKTSPSPPHSRGQSNGLHPAYANGYTLPPLGSAPYRKQKKKSYPRRATKNDEKELSTKGH